ncbi:TPR domain-containing protein [Trichoderma compactum]
MVDLEEAIRLSQEAVDITPLNHRGRPRWLNTLGARLGDRYARTGMVADLEEAIRILQEAVSETPVDDPDKPTRLNNLGDRLNDRYSRAGAMADLEEAIRLSQEAINITAPNHPDRARWLNNLGARLGERYSRTKAITDLEDAICQLQEAINTNQPADAISTTTNHPSLAKWNNNLASQKIRQYASSKSRADLESAIWSIQRAINGTPLDHPDRATWLVNLGAQLINRYSSTRAIEDLEESKKCLVQALHSSISSVSIRVSAGRCFLSTPFILDDPQAYTVANTTNSLIPLLTPRSLQNSDKQYLLSEAVGISSDAAAIALHINKGPLAAIECLETGRGIIAGALFKNHEISILQRHHPDVASSFLDSRSQLDKPATQHLNNDAENSTRIAETEGSHRRDAEQQLLRDLEKIRSIKAEMLDAASHGPIVILNVSQHRCDALIVEQSEVIDYHAYDLDSIETLGWLWDDIVCPVLDDLGFTTCPSGSQLPRVWWIPTGKLTKFPLHAAGHHFKGTKETALDRAVIHKRESLTLTTVAMNKTKGQTPLQHASREVDAVLAVLESPTLQHTQPLPYKNDVLTALKTCKIFHFAGHGYTHVLQPLKSTLLLEDWEQGPLTVENLLETDLSSPPPFLAYLSACGTGQIQHEKSVDESIHIANACQLAGFRHVIGTLWSVDDELCVSVARMTYEFLRDKSMRDECVSQGLHHATKILRDQWVERNDENAANMEVENKRKSIIVRLREARHAQLDDTPVITRPFWVPYVHFGV